MPLVLIKEPTWRGVDLFHPGAFIPPPPETRNQFYISSVLDKNSERIPVIFCKGSFTGINESQVSGIIGIIIQLTDKNISFIKQAIKKIENGDYT